jgi:hypothetical protein
MCGKIKKERGPWEDRGCFYVRCLKHSEHFIIMFLLNAFRTESPFITKPSNLGYSLQGLGV